MKGNYKHGLRNHLHYARWKAMNQRCSDASAPAYERYGARGITVCPEWTRLAGPQAFCEWADSTYTEGLQLDRINNDAGYSPDNCRWVTPSDNQVNQRPTRKKSSTLPTGVYNSPGNRFAACIQRQRKKHYLGTFATPDEASKAYQNARMKGSITPIRNQMMP